MDRRKEVQSGGTGEEAAFTNLDGLPRDRLKRDSMGFPEQTERSAGAGESVSRMDGRLFRRPVLMSIRAEQDCDSLRPEVMELMTEGFLERTPEGLSLRYEESELTGMEGTATAFHLRGPQVILQRTGTVCSQMVFEAGRQHTSLYETPYGELSVDILTSRLQNSVSEEGGALEIQYSIAVEHASTGKNRFKIHVQRKRETGRDAL